MITCLVCDREFRAITNSHLATHGLTGSSYRLAFPGAGNGKRRVFRMSMDEAAVLYQDQRLSANAIAKLKGVHPELIRRELKHYGFHVRSERQRPNVFRYDPTGHERLEALAIGLWMGEGTKRGKRVELTNCDPTILRVWLSYLVKVCHVDVAKLRLRVQIHDAAHRAEAELYWQTHLGIDVLFRFSQKRQLVEGAPIKQPMGTATLQYNSKFLLELIQRRAVELADCS
jgi:hypothetical protein